MPIRPELRHFYRTPEYRIARERLVKRAKDRCEQCRVHNRALVVREGGRKVRIVLTMAHLDHNPANNQHSNLKLLCQRCHLAYDQLHHKETRSIRKDRARPLLSA